MNLPIFLCGTTSFTVSFHTVHLKRSQYCLLIGYTSIQNKNLKKKKKDWLQNGFVFLFHDPGLLSCHLLSQLSSPNSPVFSFSMQKALSWHRTLLYVFPFVLLELTIVLDIHGSVAPDVLIDAIRVPCSLSLTFWERIFSCTFCILCFLVFFFFFSIWPAVRISFHVLVPWEFSFLFFILHLLNVLF